VVSGFYDSSNFLQPDPLEPDGGPLGAGDIVLPTTGWAQRVHFPNANDGLIMDLIGDSAGNLAQYTTDGGATATDWDKRRRQHRRAAGLGCSSATPEPAPLVLPELISAAGERGKTGGLRPLGRFSFRRTCFLPE